MTRKQFNAKYPSSKIVKLSDGTQVTLYRSYDRKGNVIYVSIPE